jgi:tellurite resistance protein TehA-like permease
MGTAIIANGAHALPLGGAAQEAAAGIWLLALLLLVTLGTVRLAARRLPDRIRALDDPSTAVFLGCPPMALLAVGGGALGAGTHLLGGGALPVLLGAALWITGAVYAVAVAVLVPRLLAVRHRLDRADSLPTWLLPVVAPMVAAAVGPALIPHLPPGLARHAMLALCTALFAGSLLGVLALLPGVLGRLRHGGPLPMALVPTMFLILGPLGQSATAAAQFAGADSRLHGFALVYGVTAIGVAILWLGVAGTVTVRALRGGMPFAMTWWGYTFPVGTCVTGAAGLWRLTGQNAFLALALALFALLLTAWAVVCARTLGGLRSGTLPG